MPHPLLATLLRRLARAPAALPAGEDGPLLDRFLAGGDQAAFAELVRRHGPMVRGVCRRVLGDAHDAEDAFQATFLVLARKAGQVRERAALGGWLYTVAYRLALRARRARRPQPAPWESAAAVAVTPGADPASAAVRRELRAVLDAEVARLPEAYRAAVVACDLEGLTHAEAAARLRCPVGSVKSRLARARSLLSARLARRGVAVAGPALAGAAAEGAAPVPVPVLEITARAAAAFAAGRDAPGLSAAAVSLARGALRTMARTRFLIVGLLVTLCAAAAFGAAWGQGRPEPPAPPAGAEGPPPALVVPEETPQLKADREAVVRGNTALALDLYRQVGAAEANRGKNVFLAPSSVSAALAMTAVGARGQTAEEMARVLHLPLTPDRRHPAFASLVGRLQAPAEPPRYVLAVANALWGQRGHPWLAEFLQTTYRHYGAGLRQVDFAKDPEGARQTINAWVAGQTRDRVKALVPPLTPDTRVVLTNAVYFKGDWKDPFDKKLTRLAPFLGTPGPEAKVPLMTRVGEYGYFEGDDFQALELPYKGDQLAMVVLLPRKPEGLAAFEVGLTADRLAEWLGKLGKRSVVVNLPRFQTTARYDLVEAFKALGMEVPFGPRADFSGMDGTREIRIGAIIHQTFVEVNEEGTEAAGATAVIGRAGARPPARPVFRADHPFVFLIREKATGSILFLGRLEVPAE